MRLLVSYQHRNNATTLNSGSITPMPSQYFYQHQDRSKINLINQDNACCKGITKSQTEFTSPSRQIFILKVYIHNTISDSSKNYHKQSRLFSELILDSDSNYLLLSKGIELATLIHLLLMLCELHTYLTHIFG